MHSLTARPFLAFALTALVFLLSVPVQTAHAESAFPALSSVTDCNECTEKVVSLTLRYEGATAKRIIVQTKNADAVYYDAVVQPGATFSFTGDKKDNAFGDNNLEFIILDQNSNFNPNSSDFGQDSDLNVIEFHVSCSKPVVIGMDTAQQDEWDNGDENDAVSNDPDKGKLFVAGATEKSGNTLCAPPTSSDEAFCYLIADNDNFKSGSADGLTFLDGSFNEFFIGNTGTANIEGLTLVPETGILYGSDASKLVTLNKTTGVATIVGSFGSAAGEYGTISLSDVDGLAWDPFQDIMFAVNRRNGEDVLFQVNLTNGKAVKNAFGVGVDYVGVDAINSLDDIDDLAISTVDGKMYAIQNENGQDSRLILINKTTGQTTDLGDLDVQNVEGLGFHPDGRLLGITGDSFRSVIEISYAPFSSTTTQISTLGVNSFGDYEGIACLTEPDNMIMGSVFVDPKVIDLELVKTGSVSSTPSLDTITYTVTLTNNNTGSANAPQAVTGVAAAGVTVELYRDLGVVGTYEPGTDVLVATTVTAANGSYGFDISANGDFLTRVLLSSVTNLAVTPTDNIETMTFAGFGDSSANHDFYFTTFTTATGVSVKDTFPANATFVSASTASGSFNNGTMTWSPANLAPGASATLTINATSTATSAVENCAEVMTANQTDIDSTPGNGAGEDDQDCFSYDPPRDPGNPDVRVGKTSSATTAGLGDTFTYTLTATNGGAVAATGVVLTDNLPYGVAYVSANPASGISYDSNTHAITWTVGNMAAGATVNVVITVNVDWMSGTFTGSFLGDGVYKLRNHPDGNVRPPYYGLRLDKLFGGVTPVTFDFEHAQSDMRMRIENGGTKVVLYGQVWGGKDNGTSYDFAGLWKVQMIYNGTVSTVPGDDDLYVTAESDFGTIVPQYTTAHFSTGQVFQLVPKSDGNFSFRLGNEDNDNGHRGFNGISGWGWLNHNGDGNLATHKASSDWLFTATPAPGTIENCVFVSAMNESDDDTSNDEACIQTPPFNPGANSLSGTVFIDANQDGFLNGGEAGQGSVTINVYRDLNGNGVREGGEPLFASTVTAANGTYSVSVPTVGHFVIESVYPASYPASAVLTTDNIELSYFPGFGLTDPNNNFGFYVPTGTPGVDIKVEKTGDLSSADLGDSVVYTLTASNIGTTNATGVVLTDTLPYGVAFVSANPASGISYDSNSHTVTWTVGALASGASTDVDLTVEVDWMTGTFTGSFLQDGYYRLNNHPVHGQALPNYGLRLDQLFGQTGPITFDFENAQSDMRMRIENGGTKVTIFGTTWGGIDAGSSYTNDGLWEIYFQYNGTVQGAPGDDDLLSYTETDNGSIRPLYSVAGQFTAGDSYALVPKSDGQFAFRLGNENDDNGWRAFDGISGWGWLDHDGPGTLDHYSASDWGFTASPAPSDLENCVALSGVDQTDVNAANDDDCFVTTTPPTSNPGVNIATGVVFFDANQNGVRNAGEPGQENVTVTVYRDLNSNGAVDGGDSVFSTYVTPANGFYAAFIPEIGDFVITTSFPGTYPAGASLTTDNVETAVFASYGNIDSGNDFGFYAAGLTPDVDLSLEKTASATNVQLNDTFTYTLTLRNSSLATQAATGIEVWDTMPAGIDVLSTTPSSNVLYNAGTGALKWTVASLAPGAAVQLTIQVRADAEGTMVNCAQVGTATGNDLDSTPGNSEPSEDDYDCATVEVSNGPVTGSIGDFVFQDVNNNGLWDAGEPGLGGVLVRLYAGVCGPTGTPIALRTSQANGSYLFTGLPAGSYCVDVRDDTVPFGYVLSTGNDPLTVNLAQGETFDDADFGYYYDPQLTTVDLELVKEVDTSSPALNENVTFTITIRNQGPGTATNVIVRDIIPVGLQFVSSNASQGGYEATKLGYWTIGTLEPGQTEVLTITTTVVITNMIENIAQVVAVDQPDIDSTPGNGVPSEDDQDNAIVESRGPGAAGDITRAECADIGTINAMLYEPNADIVLAGSEVGSVHISNDQGQNWPVFMQANNAAPISDIVATADGSVIYVGTFGDGVWRSTDSGDTWSKYKLGTNTVNDLDLDENNNFLYAAVDKKVMYIDLGSGTTGTVAGDPFNDQVLAVVYNENTNILVASSAGSGAWKYDGVAWTEVNSGLPIGKINAMIVTPGGAILAGTNSDGVYVFGGAGWFQYGMGLDGEPVESLGLGGNGEILAGARESGAYYFNQLSGEWESIGNLPIFTVASMTAGAQGEVYAGAPGEGIYVIYDTDFDGIPDQAHQVANFMTNAVIQDMVVAPNGDIYAASYGYGVLYSSDGGNCWTRMNRGLDNLWTFAIARKTDGTLFIGIWADGKGGIWRSTDEGRNWEFLAYPTRQIISLAIDPNNEDIIYAGANLAGEGSIVMSTNGGDSWTQLQSFIQPVWSIQIDPNNSNRVVVGTLGDGVYESLDQGGSWTQIGAGINGLTDANGFDLKFGPTGHLYAATNRGVYRYDDQGGFPTYSWSLYGIGSEDYQMRTIEFVGADIYAGTWNAGLVMYDSMTGMWTDLGLGDIPVIAFAVHQASQTLVIGTNGSGVFLNANIGHSMSTSVEDELVSSELPSGYSLEQNYPNPFNPQTTIPFNLVASGHVRMAVYDVLGREVNLLVDQTMQAGQHRVTWEAGQLPTGNYLVRLEAGGKVMTRSMVLMK